MFVLVTPGIAFITQLAMKLIKRFHVAVGPFSNRSQMTSKCGRNKNVVLEVWSVISYCTDPRRWSRRLCVCPPTEDEMRVGFSLFLGFSLFQEQKSGTRGAAECVTDVLTTF